jgi:hypothetical protein
MPPRANYLNDSWVRTGKEIAAEKNALHRIRPKHCRKFAQFSREWYIACNRAFVAAMEASLTGEPPPPQPRRSYKWTAAEDERLRHLRDEGLAYDEIAERLGVSTSCAWHRARKVLKLPGRYRRAATATTPGARSTEGSDMPRNFVNDLLEGA